MFLDNPESKTKTETNKTSKVSKTSSKKNILSLNIKKTVTIAASNFIKKEITKKSNNKIKIGKLNIQENQVSSDSLFYKDFRICDSFLVSTDFTNLSFTKNEISSIYFYGLKLGNLNIPKIKLNISPSSIETGSFSIIMDIKILKMEQVKAQGKYQLSENLKDISLKIDSIYANMFKGNVKGSGIFSTIDMFSYNISLNLNKVDLNPLLKTYKSKIKLPPNFSGSFELSDSSKSLDSLVSKFSPIKSIF